MSRMNLQPKLVGRRFGMLGASFAGALILAMEQTLAADPRPESPSVATPSADAPSRFGSAPASTPVDASQAYQASGLNRHAERDTGDIEGSKLRIVVSVADRKLFVIEGDRVVKVYPVAVGAQLSPSPAGEFKVTSRLTSPTWYHPGKVVPPGKSNPLGTRWVGLSRKGYGIHGTNAPDSIGHAASHGCIRMRNRDVEQLFGLVRVGDTVEITPDFESKALAQVLAGASTAEPKTAPPAENSDALGAALTPRTEAAVRGQ